MVEGQYISNGIEYTVYLNFDSNKLVSVNMRPQGTQKYSLIGKKLANELRA